MDQAVDANYFNLDDVVASNSNISCTMKQDVDTDIYELIGLTKPVIVGPRGFKTDIPLWLVAAFKNFSEVIVPKAYNDRYQNVLNTNASSANIEKLQQYFYQVGSQLCGVIDRENGLLLSECLLKTLVQRIPDVVSKALQGTGKPDKIDHLEKELFEVVLKWKNEMSNWSEREKRKTNKRKIVE